MPQKDIDTLSDEIEDNHLQKYSEELTENLKEEVVIERLQKFSLNNYLYRIALPNSQCEVKISLDSSDFIFNQIESKYNLSDKFDTLLEKELKGCEDKSDRSEFFYCVILTMKSCNTGKFIPYDPQRRAEMPDRAGNQADNEIFADILPNQSNQRQVVKNQENTIEPFIPSPRAAGF